ncbi:MAG: Rrf2 family transcriptional regulator [Terriglobales bacterium]
MLTRAADYATRVMIHLASLPDGTRVQRTALAEATDVPESFMSKVLQGLVRARLISSRSGVNGGFELAVPPSEVSLLDVIEAIDGPLQLNVCVGPPRGCGRQAWCGAHTVWTEAQDAMTRILRRATVAEMAAKSTSRRAAARKSVKAFQLR